MTPTTQQIKPAVANPLLFSFVSRISFRAILENIIPITPRITPRNGIKIDKMPRVTENN
jgi:hypothetical protein